ncbi:hypothetical protein [Portibacter marinus]|uniref:hypothetical protein n=1 Tax=Portibacter marinus TaxID=2898660 RepID=UPI001F3894AD|nr:hypothetical protein [Portibacter marinus]
MSQFHYPRLHFSGETVIDPATGNNNYHYPLVCYEPNTARVVLPPRIYIHHIIEEDTLKVIREFEKIIQYDSEGDTYISISAINTPEKFKRWMTIPLGEDREDVDFHILYQVIKTEKEGKLLQGLHPGYWNYYGTMNFSFEQVLIHSIETEEKTFRHDDEIIEQSMVHELLGSEVYFVNDLGKRNAVMIDVSPAMSIFTQVFSDHLVVSKNGTTLLKHNCYKMALRQINASRMVDSSEIYASSGTFYTSILFESPGAKGDIQSFFEENVDRPEDLLGIGVRYDLYGLEENQQPDYEKLGPRSNPACTRILGTFYPLLKNELRSASMDRLLVPGKAFKEKLKFGATYVKIDKAQRKTMLDFIGAWPLQLVNGNYKPFAFDECRIVFNYFEPHLPSKHIEIESSCLSMESFMSKGGIYEFVIPADVDLEALFDISIVITLKGKDTQVLKELPVRLISDQTGLYREEKDNSDYFLNNDGTPEKCILRVIDRGRPAEKPADISVHILQPKSYSKGMDVEILDSISITGQSAFRLANRGYGNFFYVFFPFENNVIPIDLINYMLHTSSYINVRVLCDYQMVERGEELTFEIIYEELLKDYDLIYPASGIITPFNSQHFEKIHSFLKKIMVREAWGKYLYMPSSRDMPDGKRKLLFKYLDQKLKSSN